MKNHNSSFKVAVCFILFVLFLSSGFSGNVNASKKEVIQMAILLDTSNSMDGLIGQAKTQLWKIVNELAVAKKDGKSPSIEVALYEYGKSSIPSEEGYLRIITEMTSDLDLVSEKLFSLTTNGGSEYCGMVIGSAIHGLKWSKDKDVYKVIFIAGNEPFTQGSVDYRKSCSNAISKGIIVNTIFCGNRQEGINTHWKDGADLADGKYMNIDQNEKVAYIEAPQDKEIARLGQELNKTYIAYGRTGMAKKKLQEKQDSNTSSMSEEAVIQRSVAKASSQYRNSGWDIVDAYREGSIDLKNVDKDSLPAEMRNMSEKERKAYIKKVNKKRSVLQKKIKKLNNERKKFISKESKNRAKANTLDAAMIKAIHEQAVKKNYSFD